MPARTKEREGLAEPRAGTASSAVLEPDAADRWLAEERLRRQGAILNGIARIFRQALLAETEEELGRACLAVAEEVTQSEFGFIGELNRATGRLDDLAISDPGWEGCRMQRPDGHARRVPVGFEVRGIYGRVVRDGRALFTNEPRAHPDSVGTPPGHPGLTAFVGVPLLDGGRTVGMIGLGNREGGYGPEELAAVEALAPAIVQAFLGKRARESLRRSEERHRVLTKLYAVLSRVNEAIVRAHEEKPLLEEVCRIVAEEGDFPLVWVGFLDGRALPPVAWCGPSSEYLREIRIEVDGELGRGPTGTAVREDRPVVNDDFDLNPTTTPWRAAALAHGFRASAAFPLHRRGEVVGALTLYAGNPGAFTAEHRKLLGALAADLSYALGAIEAQRLRSGAEQALRESERSLREAHQRKDEFLGVLSHELRNPLAPIRSSIFILDRSDPSSDEFRRAKAIIRRQVDHLSRIVDDLLDVTRIARGKIALRQSRIDLAALVRQAAEDHAVLAQENGVALATDVPAGPVWLDGDPTRLAQVVGNLLHNATKFTPRGGSVTLALAAEGGAAVIRVRDSGVGIEPALLGHVFEPFVQAERTLARTNGGLGLGLALVKGITELHHGTVRATSAGAGQGAELAVRLPLAGGGPPETTAAPRPAKGVPRRVLVVDDNRDSAETLGALIGMFGHQAEVAHDGETGLAKARAHPPDLIFCDIGLPGMSGFDVVRALRSEEAFRRTAIYAMTGYAQPEDRRRTAEAGFDGHVAKPADPDEIRRLLG